MEDCIFCRIIAGQAPAEIIYQDEMTLAFLDRNPAGQGHTLVVPRAHVPNIYALDDTVAASLMQATVRVARLLKGALRPEGMTLAQSNERAGFQSVFHLHIHVIPRWVGDGIRLPWIPRPGDPVALEALAAGIRKFARQGQE